MTRKGISASALGRYIACPGSELLPHRTGLTERVKRAGKRGQDMHLYRELRRDKTHEEAVQVLTEVKGEPLSEDLVHELLCMNLDALVHDGGRDEVAYVYSVVTGQVRELGKLEVQRDYGKLASKDGIRLEIPGTVDEVYEKNGRLYVDDLKTGYKAPEAKGNTQLLFLGMCAAAVRGHEEVTVAITRPNGDRDEHTLDGWDFWPFRKQLEDATKEAFWQVARAEHGLPIEVHVGPHCRYCPARKDCPEKGKKGKNQ